MADPFISLTIGGSAGPIAIARGQARTLTFAATDGEGGAGISVTGAALEVRSPDGDEDVLSGSELTAGGTGVYTAVVTFDVAGTWVIRATCDGPTPASSADLSVAVTASAADAPIPAPPAPWVQDAEQSADEAAQSAADAAASASLAGSIGISFATRADAVAAAAAGDIPAAIVAIGTLAHTTPGDGGGATYVRAATKTSYLIYTTTGSRVAGNTTLPLDNTATPLLAIGMTVTATGVAAGTTIASISNTQITLSAALTGNVSGGATIEFTHDLYFADALGGYWEFDADDVRLEQNAYFGVALGVNPSGDCYAQMVRLSAYLACKGGGAVRLQAGRRYRLATSFQQPINMVIEGDGNQGWRRRYSAGGAADYRFAPGLVMALGVTIFLATNSLIERTNLMREGVATGGAADTLLKVMDIQRDMSLGGTLVQITGSTKRTATLRDVNFLGADLAVDAEGCPGFSMSGCSADCNAFARVTNAGGEIEILHCTRSSALVDGGPTGLRTLIPTALYDSGGVVGMTLSTAHLMAAGEMCSSSKLPWTDSRARQTINVIDATNIKFPNLPWDVAYAAWSLTNSEIYLVPGTASRISALSDSGGKIRVQTTAPLIFDVGHWNALLLDDQPGQGWYQVLTVNSTTDYVLDAAWDAGYAATVLTYAEITAMPSERNGADLYLDNVDGSTISGNGKSGDGVFLNGTNCNITWSHEGGRQGELDVTKPGSWGLWLSEKVARFNQWGGAWKSVRTGLIVDARTPNEVNLFGVQFSGTDATTATSMDLRRGYARFFSARRAGTGVILVDTDFAGADFFAGDFDPSNISAAAADVPKIRFHAVDDPAGNDVALSAGHHRWQVYDRVGGAVDAGELTTDGWDLTALAVSVPTPTLPAHAVRLQDIGYRFSGSTTDATPLRLTTDGAAVSGTNIGPKVDNVVGEHARIVQVEVRGERTGGSGSAGDSAVWLFPDVMLSRNVGAGSTAVAGGGSAVVPTRSNGGGSTYRVAVIADTTRGGIDLTVTGAATTNVTWAARMTDL